VRCLPSGKHGVLDLIGWATFDHEGGGAGLARGLLGSVTVERRVHDDLNMGIGASYALGRL
jgi:hypothetical protein